MPRTTPSPATSDEIAQRLREAGERANAEAAARRAAANRAAANTAPGPKEFGGSSGPEPTRFGDWEKNGIASDF